MTLADKTGFVNMVVLQKVFEKRALLIKTTSFLGIAGAIQQCNGPFWPMRWSR